jgi:ABC-type uncharacterized transport system substrate-binding protein
MAHLGHVIFRPKASRRRAKKGAGALLVSPDLFFVSRYTQFVTLAARHAVPTINFDRAFAEAGGPMSYDTSFRELFRHVGVYVGRILKGEKPGELPVARPTRPRSCSASPCRRRCYQLQTR